ncbi:MAG: SOS response-associated peptidase [Bacteroidia bacterium]
MCYDIKSHKNKQLKEAIFKGADEYDIEQLEREIEELEKMAPQYHHVSGFDHPDLLLITDDYKPHLFNWGLIPYWIKDSVAAEKIRNTTLNARGETLFEKPAFREAAKKRRCLVIVDGFYEHHHCNKRTYPFYIQYKDNKAMVLAGIWERWKNNDEIRNTFSIVTCAGNSLLEKIHNNPKMEGPRMPLILPPDKHHEWLKEIKTEDDLKTINDLIKPMNAEELIAYTVPVLRGKNGVGNKPEASEKFIHDDFNFEEYHISE